jgi:Rad3-related DNA helicase
VSSKYTRRGEEEYKKVASYLLEMVRQEKGNYLAFFPSYKFMEDTLSFLPESEEYELLVQKKNMPEEERQAFLKRFAVGEAHERSLLGVSVLGGIFSEGIDLKEDALIGVAVVGTGLPKVSEEQDLIRQYYESIGENGFDFAYRFPGFNKVLQAAGRLIRTPEDTGVILLLDERFLYRDTLSLFPREWAEYTVTDLENVGDEIRLFRRFL